MVERFVHFEVGGDLVMLGLRLISLRCLMNYAMKGKARDSVNGCFRRFSKIVSFHH